MISFSVITAVAGTPPAGNKKAPGKLPGLGIIKKPRVVPGGPPEAGLALAAKQPDGRF